MAYFHDIHLPDLGAKRKPAKKKTAKKATKRTTAKRKPAKKTAKKTAKKRTTAKRKPAKKTAKKKTAKKRTTAKRKPAKKTAKHSYTVQGPPHKSHFPMDMLRYDGASFATKKDEERSRGGTWTPASPNTKVKLLSDRKPNVERWNSYGWSVLDMDGKPVRQKQKAPGRKKTTKKAAKRETTKKAVKKPATRKRTPAHRASGVVVECAHVGGKLRVRALPGQGYDSTKNVSFPKHLRKEGSRFVVDALDDKGTHYRWVGEPRPF